MFSFYCYITLVFVTLILMTKALHISTFAPNKIKMTAIIVISVMILRDISLIILSLAHNIKYLYLLKPIFFLNFICIPLLALIVLYIFIRRDNISFSYIFIAAAVLLGLYAVVIYKCPTFIEANGVYGYSMSFNKDFYLYWCYIILNTIILFLSIVFLQYKNINKLGIGLVAGASFITIVELILWIIGVRILQENIIGDIMWSITILYALNKIKKKIKEVI